MTKAPATGTAPHRGTFPNGMEYVTWGPGPRTMLFLEGGPGSSAPGGIWLRLARRRFAPYVGAGYAVWLVTRRRHMPPGHTIADMADDYAEIIHRGLGGHVDLVVGESYGGMIAQYLAATHPQLVGHLALVVSGARVSDWCRDIDRRMATALARGDLTGAGTVFGEYLLPGPAWRGVRRLLAPLMARRLVPAQDALVELESEIAGDSRPVLPRITRPVLVVAGDRDRFFPPEVVRETVALIPDCRVVWHAGHGHLRVAAGGRATHDVLAFAEGR